MAKIGARWGEWRLALAGESAEDSTRPLVIRRAQGALRSSRHRGLARRRPPDALPATVAIVDRYHVAELAVRGGVNDLLLMYSTSSSCSSPLSSSPLSSSTLSSSTLSSSTRSSLATCS